MPAEWDAVMARLYVWLDFVPTTTGLPPFTTALRRTGTSAGTSAAVEPAKRSAPAFGKEGVWSLDHVRPSSACAAGRRRADRARALETAATVARIRMCSPVEQG